jgi:predicted oxidoreductase
MFDNGWNSYNDWLWKRLGDERLAALLNRMRDTTKLDYEDVKAHIQNRIKEIER